MPMFHMSNSQQFVAFKDTIINYAHHSRYMDFYWWVKILFIMTFDNAVNSYQSCIFKCTVLRVRYTEA